MAFKPIRVLIVDDSEPLGDYMSRMLSMDLSIEVLAVVSNPNSILEMIRKTSPTLISMDIEMKYLDYRSMIDRIHRNFPRIPIVLISAKSNKVFDALKAGAVDFVVKPSLQTTYEKTTFLREVQSKFKTVFSASYKGKSLQPVSAPPRPAANPNIREKPISAITPKKPLALSGSVNSRRIIAIGASTGGTEAILAVVRNLPPETPGIVIVQHMPPVFTRMYAERLNRACRMRAKEAQNGDRVQQGLILVAEGSQHMRVMRDALGYTVRLDTEERVSGHRPSVDVLFDTVATSAGENAIGVLLTGMGADGAKNLLKMREAGAYTIGQDEASCVVYGMPMVAYNLGAVVEQLPLDSIAEAIIRVLSK